MIYNIEKQIAVALISDSGFTFKAVKEATQGPTQYGHLPRTDLGYVITSPDNFEGRKRAAVLGLSQENIILIDPKKPGFDEKLWVSLVSLDPDFIGQWGWSHYTPREVTDEFDNIMVNQHGAPVNPDFYDFGGPGMSCPQRFLATRLMFVRETGRNFWNDPTAQRVDECFCKGRVLNRGRVPILETDTIETLQKRNIGEEWRVQIKTVHDFEGDTVTEKPNYAGMGIDLVKPCERPLLEQCKTVAGTLFTVYGEPVGQPDFRKLLDHGRVQITESEIKRLVSHLNSQSLHHFSHRN